MPTLNVDCDFLDDPRNKRLVGRLGEGAELLVLRLWSYCGKYHAENGSLAGYSASEIERLAGWRGKAGAMVEAMLADNGAIGNWMMKNDAGVIYMARWLEEQGHISAYRKRGKARAAIRWQKVSTGDASSNASGNASCIPSGSAPSNPTGIPSGNASCNAFAVQCSAVPPPKPPEGMEGVVSKRAKKRAETLREVAEARKRLRSGAP